MSLERLPNEWHVFPNLQHNLGVVITIWAPVVLVYFMDMQMWYAMFSTFWGGLNGAFQHLGEIQTLGMLRSRFVAIPGEFGKKLIPKREEIAIALDMAKSVKEKDEELMKRIHQDCYIEYAVTECYDKLLGILYSIIVEERDKKVVDGIRESIKDSIQRKSVVKDFRLDELPQLSAKFGELLSLLKDYDDNDPVKKNTQIANMLQDIMEMITHDIMKCGQGNTTLRVAYIDEVEAPTGNGTTEKTYYSVLVKGGEKYDEDNYIEEAFKMRNVLEEFESRKYGKRKPTILGLREHIFTGRVRFHYGHPDIFDRLFHITRGGISKASKTINLSEDIFSGFNSTMRGGLVTHHEYIQVGKGREVGMNQISNFEAKVANGNGEQTLSRDIYRLGHKLDFFRMLSFYFTTITVLIVYIFVYGNFYLAMSGLGKSMSMDPRNQNVKALENALAPTDSVFQLGSLLVLPMLMEVGLEKGFFEASREFLNMQLLFASVFFTFQLGTKAHYYGRTILHGAPFLFNPSGLDWQKTVDDYSDWKQWMGRRGGIGMSVEQSWEAWWVYGVSWLVMITILLALHVRSMFL
ncbi:hypothetical protein HU200_050109 [Digitaria exilis]|uniref:Uncharacterized protein n=1 Tax=Digitaria exilis TaxID=1010633 RepID=A0A835E602_9POAL|nr:hypothetical protein HU200_050109 [Digitaria exilis]